MGGTCDEYGGINMPANSTQVGARESSCSSTFQGTWSFGPCSLTNASFGCRSVALFGNLCAEVDTSWYYGPDAPVDAAATYCPESIGMVVYP